MLESSAEQLEKKPVNSKAETLIRVLHVDDDAEFLKSSKRILEMHYSFQIETAISVKEALQKLRQKLYDVIVSDYRMPERDGLDLLKELRDKGNDVPFILFTGKGREEVAIKALNLGADQYINKIGKPEVVYHELMHAVREVVKIKEAEKALQKSEENYRRLFENAPVVILTFDLKGNVTSINKVAEEYGFKKGEIVGKNMRKFVFKRYWPKLLKDFVQLSRGKTVQGKFEIETPKGKKTASHKSNPIIIDNKVVGVQSVLTDITERTTTEEKLRESEEKFRNLAEKSPNMIFINKKGRVVYANKKCEEIMGYNREEFYSPDFKFFTLIAPRAIEQLKSSYSKHMKGEEVDPFEYTLSTKEGKRIEAILTTKLITFEGEPAILGIVTDITKRKKAEEKLRKSEEKYRSIVELSPDGIATMNMKGIVTSVNKAFLDLTGFSKDEIVGKHFTKLGTIRARDLPKYMKMIGSIFRGKKLENFEFAYFRKDGTKRLGDARISLLKEKGKTVGLQAILRDITDRKKVEEALRRSEEKYRKQFEEAMDAIFLADAETGIILDCNRAATKLIGRKKSELVGQHQRILHPPESINGKFSRTFKQHLKEREGQVLEAQVITKSGEIRDVAIKANVFELGDKRIIQGTFRDITERKKMEKQLKESEEKYRKQFEEAIDAIVLADAETGILLDCNRAATKLVGRKRSELVGQHQRILHPSGEIEGGFSGTFEQHRKEKEGQLLETHVITKTGEIRDVTIKANILELGDKKLLQGIFRDITEQKKAEEALRESEERFRQIVENAEEWIWEVDANGLYTYASPVVERVLGYTPEELVGKKHFYDLFHPEDRENLKKAASWVFDEKQPFRGFFNRNVHKNGNIVWLSTSGVPILDDEGNLLGYRGSDTDITEQKKAEEALRESEEKHRELLNGMNDTAWVIDFDGNIVDVNDAATEVLGYSREEFRSIGITGIDSNLDPKEIKGLVEGMPADEVQVFETVHTTKDGKKIPVEISSSLVTYRGERAILSIARNITERKKAREKLRQSEERYRTVFENTGTAMCILEEDKTISMVNRRFEELSGYSWKELDGKKWTEFVTKEYLERMQRYHKARRKKGGKAPKNYAFDFVNKNGQIRNVLLTIELIPGTKKSVASILDITERKEMEKQLKESEEKYRKQFEEAMDAIFLADAETGITLDCNRAATKLIGRKKSELVGQHQRILHPPDSINGEFSRSFEQHRKGKEAQVLEDQIITKTGEIRDVLINATTFELAGRNLIHATFHDITERKEAEKKLDEIMNELVTINEKLGVVGKLTRHDARNKLSVIANNVYLAKQKMPANHGALEFLGDVESAVAQIEDIFDFARNYEMLGVEELSYMDVGKSVEEAAMLLSGMNGVKLVNECQGLIVMADSLLRQLFYNLIDDTLKHGEKVSQIRVYYEEDEDQLKLVYEDDGVGIPEKEKELIFKEGYGKGTGYGLYLIKKICEEYGWIIRETGKQDKGAQFTMIIPKTNKNGKASYRFNN